MTNDRSVLGGRQSPECARGQVRTIQRLQPTTHNAVIGVVVAVEVVVLVLSNESSIC